MIRSLRMNELEREIYASDDLAGAGAFVAMDYNGEPKIHRGYVRPIEDEDQQTEDGAGDGNPTTVQSPPAPSLTHSATLVEDLTAQRTAAIRLEFARNHHTALASVVHALLLQTVLTHSRDHTCLDIVLTCKPLRASMKAPQNSLGLSGMTELAERFGDHVPGNPADVFQWCLARDQDELVELLAFAAAYAIDAVKDKQDYRRKQRAHAEFLAHALNLDMTSYFEATAESYFNHLTRDGIEAALTDIKGKDVASGVGRMKKAEAAAYAEGQTKGSGWLPDPLRSAAMVADNDIGSAPSREEEGGFEDDADIVEFTEAAE